MKASEIKELTTQELRDKLVEEKTNLAKLRLTHTVSQLENPLKLRDARNAHNEAGKRFADQT